MIEDNKKNDWAIGFRPVTNFCVYTRPAPDYEKWTYCNRLWHHAISRWLIKLRRQVRQDARPEMLKICNRMEIFTNSNTRRSNFKSICLINASSITSLKIACRSWIIIIVVSSTWWRRPICDGHDIQRFQPNFQRRSAKIVMFCRMMTKKQYTSLAYSYVTHCNMCKVADIRFMLFFCEIRQF